MTFLTPFNYTPDFKSECYNCGSAPTVIINGHVQPETQLCGTCFFADRTMSDWDNWNTKPEDTE